MLEMYLISKVKYYFNLVTAVTREESYSCKSICQTTSIPNKIIYIYKK